MYLNFGSMVKLRNIFKNNAMQFKATTTWNTICRHLVRSVSPQVPLPVFAPPLLPTHLIYVTIFAARGIFPIPASNVTWSKHTTELATLRHQQFVHRRPPRTMQDFAREMYERKGLRGFYAGSLPGLLQIVPYMGINFAVHDVLILLSGRSSDSAVSGIAGMGAGVISKLLVYPLDTVKKRLQAQAFWGSKPKTTNYKAAIPTHRRVSSSHSRALHKNGPMKHNGGSGPVVYEGMIDCFRQIAKREGMAAFYKGLVPSLLKSSASTGASFWLFTLTRNTLRSIHDSDHTYR